MLEKHSSVSRSALPPVKGVRSGKFGANRRLGLAAGELGLSAKRAGIRTDVAKNRAFGRSRDRSSHDAGCCLSRDARMNMRRQSRLTAEESAVCGITAIARGIREERERGSYKGGMAGKFEKGGSRQAPRFVARATRDSRLGILPNLQSLFRQLCESG